MKYSVNDVARLLGITPSAIHFLEKESLINAERNEKGHRYYNNENVFRFLSYSKYRSMGLSVKTIVKQFSGTENDRKLIYERLAMQQREAAKKAKYYEELEREAGEHLKCALQIEHLCGQYEFAKSPNILIMQGDENGWIPKDEQAQSVAQKWVHALPATRLVIKLNSVDAMDARFGYAATPQKVMELSLPVDENVEEMPSISCIHTITTTDSSFGDYPQKIFEEAIGYTNSRGFEICGKPWGRLLLAEVAPKATIRLFVELWIPIK